MKDMIGPIIVAVILFLFIALGIGEAIGKNAGYRRGQLDYIAGEIKYEIRDGEVWEKK